MKREEKELLLQDLCVRLPYGVKANSRDGKKIITITPIGIANFVSGAIDIIKPYLRPMSSMTEEEAEEYCDLQEKFLLSSQYPVTDGYALFDWLNKKMFDYRGLIPKDLALSTEVFNPYKN